MKTEAQIRDFLTQAAEGEKDSLLAGEFRPKFLWYVGTEPTIRATMFPEMPEGYSREDLARALAVVTSSIEDLDNLVFIVDTYIATSMTKTDGSRWEHGEMQKAVEEQTIDACLVRDAFLFQVADNEGRLASAQLPYAKIDDKVDFHWDDVMVHIDGDGGSMGGAFPEMMRDAVLAPKIGRMAGAMAASLGLDDEARKMHTLCAGVKFAMKASGAAVGIAIHNEREMEIAKRSFENVEVIELGGEED